ncbi:hypothetical protein BDD12DRAFT_979645 [Trichophaea hybrida]|nr:hypothetical protein BDD12DRAFT_979645 [Trichophaea hybrida]
MPIRTDSVDVCYSSGLNSPARLRLELPSAAQPDGCSELVSLPLSCSTAARAGRLWLTLRLSLIGPLGFIPCSTSTTLVVEGLVLKMNVDVNLKYTDRSQTVRILITILTFWSCYEPGWVIEITVLPRERHEATTRLLLDYDANIGVKHIKENCEESREDSDDDCGLILNHDTDIDTKDKLGGTVSIHTAREHRETTSSLLLDLGEPFVQLRMSHDRGVSINTGSEEGRMALSSALLDIQKTIVTLLQERGSSCC